MEKTFKKIELTIGAIVIVALVLGTIYGTMRDSHKAADIEKTFGAMVQKAAKNRKRNPTVRTDQADVDDPKKVLIGKILPMLVKNGETRLAIDLFNKRPPDLRPSTPDEVQPFLFIDHIGEHESKPDRGITTDHVSIIQDYKMVVVDVRQMANEGRLPEQIFNAHKDEEEILGILKMMPRK